MKVYFNSLGVVTNVDTEGDSLRQGTIGVKLEAIFNGITNTNFVATYNFKRHDNTKVSNVFMDISSENTEKFESVFNDEWFFAKAGQTSITIFLRDGENNIIAQGQVQFNIEANDYDEDFDPQITIVQYNQVLAMLAKKLQVNSKVLRVDSLPLVGEVDTYYVVKDDESETLHNVYFYNTVTHEYVWVGSNQIDLGAFYRTEEGEAFESEIDDRVTSVENELRSVAQGSPKGTYSTVSALTSAYPSGTTGIFVVLADGHWYYWNGSAWTDGGLYLSSQGAVPTTRKVAGISLANDISAQDLGDALPKDTSLNVTSENPVKNKTVANYLLGVNYEQLGEIQDGALQTDGQTYSSGVSVRINVTPNEEYLIAGLHLNNNVPLYLFLDENENIITPTFSIAGQYGVRFIDYKIVAPSNAKKVVVNGTTSSNPPNNTQPPRIYIRRPTSTYDITNQYLLDLVNSKEDKKYNWESVEFTVEGGSAQCTLQKKVTIGSGPNHTVVNCSAGTKYKVSGNSWGAGSPMVIFTDENDFVIQWVHAPAYITPSIDQTVNVPFGAKKMYVNGSGNVINIKIGVEPEEEGPTLIDFTQLADDVKGIIYKKITYGYKVGFYSPNGYDSHYNYWRTYVRKFIITGTEIAFKHINKSEQTLAEIFDIIYYDKNDTYISKVSGVWDEIITPPSNAVYLRINLKDNSYNDYTNVIYWDRYILGCKQEEIVNDFNFEEDTIPLSANIVSKALFKKIDYDLQRGVVGGSGSIDTSVRLWGRSTCSYYEIQSKVIGYYSESDEENLYEVAQILFFDKDYVYIPNSATAYSTQFTVNVPTGAKYIRMNFRHANNPSSGGYNNTPYDSSKMKRYIVGVDAGQSVVNKYKLQVDRGLTLGYKVSQLGNVPYFNFLHISDTHGSVNAINAIKIFNKLHKDGLCDALVHSGDICASTPYDETKETLLDHVDDIQGDFLLASGNHDVGSTHTAISLCYTDAQYHENVFSVALNNTTLTNNPTGKNYYYKDYAESHIRFIVLYEYETDFDLNPNNENELLYIRGINSYSQSQIDWFINALATCPANYGVVIMKHEPLNIRGNSDNPFNSITIIGGRGGQGYVSSDMIPDIVQAFMDKTSINRTYQQTGGIVTTLSAVADFSQSNGEFVCYVDGHTHCDGVNFLQDYPNQLELNIACDNFHYLHLNDSKNIVNTMLQDVINYVSIDTNKGNVHILRIGNDFSSQASRRDFISIKYRRE